MSLSTSLMGLHLDLRIVSNRLCTGYVHCAGAPVKSTDLIGERRGGSGGIKKVGKESLEEILP